MRRRNRVHAAEHLRIFVAPTGEMHEAIDGTGDFATSFGGGAAGGTRDFGDEFGGAVLEHFGGAIEDLTAIVGGGFAPTGHGSACGDDGISKIFARSVRDIVEMLTFGRL